MIEGDAMEEAYDAIILGGGINGCAIARKLTLDGRKVCVLERETVGCGTSSNSSKLIHGGLRYLETGKIGLVRESLKDRKRLGSLYPDLIKMVPFYMPIFNDSLRPWWMLRTGLAVYDLLSGQSRYRCRKVANHEFLDKFPAVKGENLKRVYVYYDGKTNDLELTRRIATDAYDAGCVFREHCRVESVEADGIARVVYTNAAGRNEIEAPILINAAGPWIDEVNDSYHLPHNYGIRKVSGIHIVIDRELIPDCMFLQTASQRIFFMIPWEEGKTIIGTTERTEYSACDEVTVQEEDVDYLLNCANHYLREPITRSDICATFLGIRPLAVRSVDDGDTTRISREYRIEVVNQSRVKFIHVYGGKLTTCLSMAEKVAARI